MALGFIIEVDDKVGKVLTPEGNIIEVPADALSGAKPGQDIDLGDEAPATPPSTETETPAPAPFNDMDAGPTPTVKEATGVDAKPVPKGAEARQQYAMQKITSMGWSPVQAAGVVGRFMQEAYPDLRTNVAGDAGISIGVGQWNDGGGTHRRSNLMKFAKTGEVFGRKFHDGGKDPFDLDTQLEYWDAEIRFNPDEKLALRTLQSAETLDDSSAAMMHYERPSGYKRSNPTRGHGYDNTVANAAAVLGTYDPDNPVTLADAGDTGGGDTMAGMETDNEPDLGLDQEIEPPEVSSSEGGSSSDEEGGLSFTPPDFSAMMNLDLGVDEAVEVGQQRIAELILSGQQPREPVVSTFGDFYGIYGR